MCRIPESCITCLLYHKLLFGWGNCTVTPSMSSLIWDCSMYESSWHHRTKSIMCPSSPVLALYMLNSFFPEVPNSSSSSSVKSHSQLVEENLQLRRENESLKLKLEELENILKLSNCQKASPDK